MSAKKSKTISEININSIEIIINSEGHLDSVQYMLSILYNKTIISPELSWLTQHKKFVNKTVKQCTNNCLCNFSGNWCTTCVYINIKMCGICFVGAFLSIINKLHGLPQHNNCAELLTPR